MGRCAVIALAATGLAVRGARAQGAWRAARGRAVSDPNAKAEIAELGRVMRDKRITADS